MRNMTLSVLQLNNYIKRIIDSEELLIGIGLLGEVSNFKISNGNSYFDLKEEGAAISCMMFGQDVIPLENGKQVLLFGRLSFYPKFGKLTFIAKTAEELGKGALYQKYIELKERLEKEGLFDQKYKKQIPLYVKKIGVVTSETGAVVHDIITVARQKNPKTDFVLYPVKVQGLGAETLIAEGIDYFSGSDVDLVIVARGGGSFEDLAPFNTEAVARSIFACKKPIISAVGHETDFSISDFAADLRCATPSVASETAVFDWYGACQKLFDIFVNMQNATVSIVDDANDNLKSLAKDINSCTMNLFDNFKVKAKDCVQLVEDKFESQFAQTKTQFDMISLKIEKSSPLALLRKGYIVACENDKRIASVDDFDVGDTVKLRLHDGIATAKIIGKEKINDGTNI